ncbi:MAG: hypothetical protein IJC48_06975 [Clostridia bacterium]|nr:hypothetical protein [Clostridia bacterium]MBQ4156717.1 hypothetical protein [Clostridia bacterium]
MANAIVFENRYFRLAIGEDAKAESLIIKETGEECLKRDEDISIFTVTQERPFNNEVKLAHPNKETVFQANRVRREGGKLIVGFEITPYEAVIDVREADDYIAFALSGFIVHPDDYAGLYMSPPPVKSFCLLRLPVKNRESFGEWMNVSFDEIHAVGVFAACPEALVDSERRKGFRVMTAEAKRDIQLTGVCAALIACKTDHLMEVMENIERDFSLPEGVKSRKSEYINASAYHTSNITPETVHEHINYAKMGGFRMMLIYYTSIFKEEGAYNFNGNYEFRKEYPNGIQDLKNMLKLIKAAGITPGIHFLHTHIGLRSRFVKGNADHRLNLTRHFTLSRALDEESDTVYVEENPRGSVMVDRCRVLRFGGEIMTYQGYSEEPPYRFTGVSRGAYETNVRKHDTGEIGGILDISEFGAGSAYINQNSSLQDEIAEVLAKIYAAGFEFVYFDGSEGVNAPFEYHVPMAQHRVYKRLSPAPVYCEGAAKSHFSWHMLSGGNAFDIFVPLEFKEKIARFPMEEAPRMQKDFTRINFGWWGYWYPGESERTEPGTQPDMLEYGTSRAAAWDCPATIQMRLAALKNHPRTKDNMEVMRRWEDVRRKGLLTEDMKEALKNPAQEHTLLIDENGEYELVPIEQAKVSRGSHIRAFVFERKGKWCASYWHESGEGEWKLKVLTDSLCVKDEFSLSALPIRCQDGFSIVPAGGRRYLITSLTKQELINAIESAQVIDKA